MSGGPIIVVRDRRPPPDPRAPLVLVRVVDWDPAVKAWPEGALTVRCELCGHNCLSDVPTWTAWTLTAADPATRRPIRCVQCVVAP